MASSPINQLPIWQHATLGVIVVVNLLLFGCGGGGTATGASPAVTTPGPELIVGAAPERPQCPVPETPIPRGVDLSNRVIDPSMVPKGLDLRGANFDNSTLSGISLDHRDLSGATFRHATIKNVDMVVSVLSYASFEGAKFLGQPADPTRWVNTTLANATLKGTCFLGANFDQSVTTTPIFFDGRSFDGTDFSYSNVLELPGFLEAVKSSVNYYAARNLYRGVKMPAPCDYVRVPYFSSIMDTTGADFSSCPPTVFENLDLSKASFDGVNLKGFSFDGAILHQASFRKAVFDGSPSGYTFTATTNLEHTVFTGASFRNISFRGVQLEGADFSGATFFGDSPVVFDHVFMRNAHFNGVLGADLRFYGCYMPGTRFNGAFFYKLTIANPNFVWTGPVDTDFSGATLGVTLGPDFSGLDLTGIHFDGADLGKTIFTRTTLTNASFVGATGHGQNFRGARAGGAIFDSADLVGAHFDDALLERASFSNAKIDGATGFTGTAAAPARLSGARFNSVSAVGVDFSNAQLYGADFTYADLSNTGFASSFLTSGGPTNQVDAAKFNGARLVNASFANAKLQGASFASANLYSKNVSGIPNARCETNVSSCSANNPVTGKTCSCATMAGADLTSTDFTGAYLAGVDFANSGTIISGTNFTGAVLIGANFASADFRAASGAVPTFQGAMLQGTTISTSTQSQATLTLTGAFLDFKDNNDNGGNAVNIILGSGHTRFRNWSGPKQVCVQAAYATPSAMPQRATLDCPDGTKGVCGAVLAGPNSSSHWWNRIALANATPAPGWYFSDASYEKATTDSKLVCNGQPVTPDW